MSVNWVDVAKLVAPLARPLGGIIGGFIPFPGGALAGEAVGAMLARSLGVEETPAAVAAAIGATPNDIVVAKLKAVADQLRAAYPAYARIEEAYAHVDGTLVLQANETARAELAVESKFKTWWRPMAGWILDAEMASLGVFMVVALYQAARGDHALLKLMQDAWPLILCVITPPAAVVGVAVWSRGNEKVTAMAMGIAPTAPAQDTAKPPAKR